MLTPSRVNVDAWHGGICASVQVRRPSQLSFTTLGLPVHDSRDSSSGLHPTSGCCFSSSPLTGILYSLRLNVLPAGGIPCRDRNQMAQVDWASGVQLRRLLLIVVAEGGVCV